MELVYPLVLSLVVLTVYSISVMDEFEPLLLFGAYLTFLGGPLDNPCGIIGSLVITAWLISEIVERRKFTKLAWVLLAAKIIESACLAHSVQIVVCFAGLTMLIAYTYN